MREDLHPAPLALQWSYASGGYRGVGVQPNHVNGLCNSCRNGTAITALILARAFGHSPDLWLNVQRCSEPREVCTIHANASGSKASDNQHRNVISVAQKGSMLCGGNRPLQSSRFHAIPVFGRTYRGRRQESIQKAVEIRTATYPGHRLKQKIVRAWSSDFRA
jgi:hypothetical protein